MCAALNKKCCPSLEILCLDNNNISKKGIEAFNIIFNPTVFKHLISLDFSGINLLFYLDNPLNSEGVVLLMEQYAKTPVPTLKLLNLSICNIDNIGYKAITSIFENKLLTNLEHLDISRIIFFNFK